MKLFLFDFARKVILLLPGRHNIDPRLKQWILVREEPDKSFTNGRQENEKASVHDVVAERVAIPGLGAAATLSRDDSAQIRPARDMANRTKQQHKRDEEIQKQD